MEVQMSLIANALRNELVNQLERNDSVFKGHLKNSVKVTFRGTTLIITTIGYGEDIEFGRPAGTVVPEEELREWCRIKLGDENASTAVAQKIFEQGTEPKPFIRNTVHQKLKEIIKRYVA
jgi:hypothetical protein